jgi:phosphoribosylanthranilate isomerase
MDPSRAAEPPSRRAVEVKICGLTRPGDAELAARLGAQYLGVVFAGGPRRVTPGQAATIVGAAGQIPVFGVFGSQGCDEILRVRDSAGLAGAQLHGGASAEAAARLRREGMEVLVVARLGGPSDLDALGALRTLGFPVLVEPRVAGALGGTGVVLSTDLAMRARSCLRGHPMILAGGLTAETVGAIVRLVRPDAVDVSSGVEQIPGIKDPQRMSRFLEALGWV